jgi:pimeloyl-ACP methyl ester carboxylesterase
MDLIAADLPRLRMPVLLVGGDRDPSLGPMRRMHRRIRGSRLIVLSPASHFANRDQPEAWNRAVLDFLARVDAAGPRRRRAAPTRRG